MNYILKNFNFLGKIKDLKSGGFIWDRGLSAAGVYLIVYEGKETPQFIIPGCGPEKYRDREVNTIKDKLEENWICLGFNRNIVYIGESESKGGVGARVKEHMKFGNGEEANAYGGRYIWQIKDHDNLLVFWKKSNNPKREKKLILKDFKDKYGKLPFANLKN